MWFILTSTSCGYYGLNDRYEEIISDNFITKKELNKNAGVSDYTFKIYLNDINDVLYLKDLVGEELIFSDNMEIEIYDYWRE